MINDLYNGDLVTQIEMNNQYREYERQRFASLPQASSLPMNYGDNCNNCRRYAIKYHSVKMKEILMRSNWLPFRQKSVKNTK